MIESYLRIAAVPVESTYCLTSARRRACGERLPHCAAAASAAAAAGIARMADLQFGTDFGFGGGALGLAGRHSNRRVDRCREEALR